MMKARRGYTERYAFEKGREKRYMEKYQSVWRK